MTLLQWLEVWGVVAVPASAAVGALLHRMFSAEPRGVRVPVTDTKLDDAIHKNVQTFVRDEVAKVVSESIAAAALPIEEAPQSVPPAVDKIPETHAETIKREVATQLAALGLLAPSVAATPAKEHAAPQPAERPIIGEQVLADDGQFEYLREVEGEFVPTGEFVEHGVNVHSAVMQRQAREGASYAARKVAH